MKIVHRLLYLIIIVLVGTNQSMINFLDGAGFFDMYNPINEFSTPLAKYFLKFAGFGYCTIDQMEKNQCCSQIESEGWTILDKHQIEYESYSYAILKHDIYKKIVIALPGTRTKMQFLQEVYESNGIVFSKESNHKLMYYFNYMFSHIKEDISTKLQAIYNQNPDYQYIFTGHSLGGAMATIISLHLVKTGVIKKTEFSPALITYGQPRTGNDIFANEVMNNIPIIHRIVRQGDIITVVPKCYTSWFIETCITSLPENKFHTSYTLNKEELEKQSEYYYAWHIGGLKLFNADMTEYVDCGVIYGDNNPDKKCHIYGNIDLQYHSRYFGERVKLMCQA